MNTILDDLNLPDKVRKELKNPLGEVVSDVTRIPPGKKLICVGDIACDHAIKEGLEPFICIYDNKTSRREIKQLESIRDYAATEVDIKNPPGLLTKAAFMTIREAIESGQTTKIFVDGEEDLLTLAAIKEAGDDTIVVYGQPNEGLVLVDVNEDIKSKVQKFLDEMG